MFEFADPWFLILVALPLVAYFYLPPRSPQSAVLIVPETIQQHMLAQSAQKRPGWRHRSVLIPSIIWLLLVVALAGPRVVAPNQALPMSGRDLMLVLDLSGSMVRDDFAVDGKTATRLEVVKTVGAEFIAAREGDRVGLVVFGAEAYVAAAPTFDTAAVAQKISDMVIGISGRATNIGDGLGLALKRFAASDAQSKVIILLSDGTNNAGAAMPTQVAALAAQMGVRIHTIALGPVTREEAPDQRGVVDAQALNAIARLSGGQMFQVRTTDDLRNAAASLDALEPTARAGLAAQTYQDFWIWPAALAGVLAIGLGVSRL
ncbi:VWA domain-containing protein [Loktanella sp. S4079]|uniref:VWA domain-containing protein n=1 Tax=Loktanella sp. S4079 TaxID=579483 RepID=UPI0005F9EB07|nr:VWA domain-containing protein [Loktanella sp. S4079]KJZ18210.1 von Willebrand factor A [Loktanella sp. S4079]